MKENRDNPETIECSELPDWLTAGEPRVPALSSEAKKLWPVNFEMVFPRVMDRIANGADMTDALSNLPIEINYGAFLRWIKKDPERQQQLKDAQELRSEIWADSMMAHARGDKGLEDVNRSKLIVDAYKWRIAADNRKKFGQATQIEVSGQVSITAALAEAAARSRTVNIGDIEDVIPIEQDIKNLNE